MNVNVGAPPPEVKERQKNIKEDLFYLRFIYDAVSILDHAASDL
jgi:hypothetical protein